MVRESKVPQTEAQMLQTAVDGMDSDGDLDNAAEVALAKEEAMQAAHMKKVNVWRRGYDALGD
uniref:hypothetical protein n=1 Tax=Paracoccus sp. TRP TaxID=412597 RepID=UPI000225F442|nr:hypothetical protein [Paracoccus sp. TRP]